MNKQFDWLLLVGGCLLSATLLLNTYQDKKRERLLLDTTQAVIKLIEADAREMAMQKAMIEAAMEQETERTQIGIVEL